MPSLFVFLFVCCLLSPLPAKQPNILFIAVDDLRPELGAYGLDYMHSPNIDRLANEGRLFERHYVQAPTCGASRYALLTGTLGPANNPALFKRATALAQDKASRSPSIPAWLRQHGFTTVSVGKVSHHPGGMGGANWDDASKLEMPHAWDRHLMPSGDWEHPKGAMHGLAHGEIRRNAGEMDVYQTAEGDDSIYPDGLITEQALEELSDLARSEQPFFLAVGIIRPHLPFGAPEKYMEPYLGVDLPPIDPVKPEGRSTWHRSGEFMKYNRWGRDPNEDPEFALEVRRHYAASVSYADAQVGRILDRLEALGLKDDTIIVLWGDHGWHLGEQAIWGKHSLFEESLWAPLIIRTPDMPFPGRRSREIVESIDLFPTLSRLASLPVPEAVDGQSLLNELILPVGQGGHAISYYTRGRVTIRTDSHRLIAHADGFLELYDHRSPEKESRNIAEAEPETARALLRMIEERAPEKISDALRAKL